MNTGPADRRLTWAIAVLAVAWAAGCSGSRDHQAFVESHDAIHPSMTMSEVFDAALADYLARMETKTVAGATRPDAQPASSDCRRHVLQIMHRLEVPGSGTFTVRVYCETNDPAARQVTPERSFKSKRELLEGLDEVSRSWAQSMSFRVESPPKQAFGVYDSYEFTTDRDGRVAAVSPVVVARRP